MAGIRSDLTNKTMISNKMRQIEVPDETGEELSFESNNEIDFEAANALMASRNMPPLDPGIQSAYNARQLAKRQSAPNVNTWEQDLAQAKQAKLTGKTKLSSAARERIELLCGMTRQIKEVLIDEKIYVIKTLKSKEHRAIMMAASEFAGTVQFSFEWRKQILARSLFEVDGADVELFLNDSSIEARLEFIDELEDLVQNRLFNEYLELVKESEIKYGLNKEEMMKEVVEDLKK